jgi:arginyl-tRNA synthetase
MEKLNIESHLYKFPNLYANEENVTIENIITQLTKFNEEINELEKEYDKDNNLLYENFPDELLDVIASGLNLFETIVKHNKITGEKTTYYNDFVKKINSRLKDKKYKWGIERLDDKNGNGLL